MMAFPLRSKRALVTDGSRGIGAAFVKRLARERADVALAYVSKPDDAKETVEAARATGVRELGGVDILVNNAGIASVGCGSGPPGADRALRGGLPAMRLG